mmetsp:Transcript_25229/g.37712  ORF Transcript_25229/g.37712 Transcript_25229/m.37712 type:complete len:104 (+) Transcript_25229:581-892(+)
MILMGVVTGCRSEPFIRLSIFEESSGVRCDVATIFYGMQRNTKTTSCKASYESSRRRRAVDDSHSENAHTHDGMLDINNIINIATCCASLRFFLNSARQSIFL